MEIFPYAISLKNEDETESNTPRDNFSEQHERPSVAINDDHMDEKQRLNFYNDIYNIGIKQLSDLKKLRPVEQLKHLLSIYELAERDTAYGMFDASKVFKDIENDRGFSPLIRIVARDGIELYSDYNLQHYWDEPELNEQEFGYSTIVKPDRIPEEVETTNDYPFDSDYSYSLSLQAALKRNVFEKNQDKLHQEFPFLPKDKQLVKIAPGTAATLEFEERLEPLIGDFSTLLGTFGLVADQNGKILYNVKNDSSSDPNREALEYLAIIHNSRWMRSRIEKTLNVSLIEIPLEAQAQLLKFMTEASNERFDKMCAVMRNIKNEKLRKRFLDSFVAADFGEDFGDSLLTIAGSERLSDGEKEEVFDLVEFCRESIDGITGLFEKFDGGQFTNEYVRAANERLTDALKVFEMIAKNGVAAGDLDWAGKVKFDFRSAIEALQYEADSLEIINRTVHDVMSGREGAYAEIVLPPEPSIQAKWRTIYHFYSPGHGHVLLYTRPEGSHTFDPAIEYGKKSSPYNPNSVNTGVEASISFTANPVNPFDFPSPYRPDQARVHDLKYYDSTTMDKVSAIRLDREGRAPGEPANDKNRDVIREIGMVSVDLAAIGDRYDTPSGKIARLISLGNLLRSKDHSTGFSLNHNTNWFNQDEYGTAEGFRKIVEYIDEIMVGLCFNHPPRKGDLNSFKGRFEKEKKKDRGRKTLGLSA